MNYLNVMVCVAITAQSLCVVRYANTMPQLCDIRDMDSWTSRLMTDT